jgi:hypothetical protein
MKTQSPTKCGRQRNLAAERTDLRAKLTELETALCTCPPRKIGTLWWHDRKAQVETTRQQICRLNIEIAREKANRGSLSSG